MQDFILSLINNISQIKLVKNDIDINKTTTSVLIHLILNKEKDLEIKKYNKKNKVQVPILLVKTTSEGEGIPNSKYTLHEPLLPLIKIELA